jgi:hypothetical protein
MKNTTLFLILLVAFSTILIAGCTQQQPVTTPASAPSVTAVPSFVVQNQGGVAIQVPVKTNQTVAVQANQTVAVKTNETIAVKANVTTAILTNKS